MNSPQDNDASTSVAKLRSLVEEFVSERNWHQFHAPKNISMGITIEAAELMEHFQWISGEESREIHQNAEKKQEVADELADVLCYALALANEMNIDVTQAMHNKMIKNRKKYPVDEYQGRYGPDDPNLQS